MINYTIFSTQLCQIILAGDKNGLSNLHLNTGIGRRQYNIHDSWNENDEFFKDIKEQIFQYFNGSSKEFNVKLNPQGTVFQKKVWHQLCQIPYGSLFSYKEIAKKIGNPNSSRAVGMASSKNPIPLIIPCHRVIGSNGKLMGFAHGVGIKQQLINIENNKNL